MSIILRFLDVVAASFMRFNLMLPDLAGISNPIGGVLGVLVGLFITNVARVVLAFFLCEVIYNPFFFLGICLTVLHLVERRYTEEKCMELYYENLYFFDNKIISFFIVNFFMLLCGFSTPIGTEVAIMVVERFCD